MTPSTVSIDSNLIARSVSTSQNIQFCASLFTSILQHGIAWHEFISLTPSIFITPFLILDSIALLFHHCWSLYYNAFFHPPALFPDHLFALHGTFNFLPPSSCMPSSKLLIWILVLPKHISHYRILSILSCWVSRWDHVIHNFKFSSGRQVYLSTW